MKKILFSMFITFLAVAAVFSAENPKVLIKTELGEIQLEIYESKAPLTAANFLRYVDSKLYDQTTFFRTVSLDNQPQNDVKIEAIQGGEVESQRSFPAIAHETTQMTGLRHLDGVISMAREKPGSATSSFFICIGDQPELDFGGRRNPDNQGFAVFGKVVSGMDVVRKIHKQPAEGQSLNPPVRIISISRITNVFNQKEKPANEPDRVAVQHILIAFKGSIPKDSVTRSQAEAQSLAVQILERAKKGEDFDALVRQYTDDEYPGIYSMSNFGVEADKEKQEYPRSRMVKRFGDVSFSLPLDGIGLAEYDPQASKYGWHIIKRLE